MKEISVQDLELESCLRSAQVETILITRKGKPIAVLMGVEGMDAEQIQLGRSNAFWKLIKARRGEKTLTRAELERKLAKS